MFNLDHEMSKWCSELARQARVSDVQIEELRDHLYSEVRRQLAIGASEEEAFCRAVEQLGAIDEITREYSKNQRIGHAISAISNIPYATQVLGLLLMTGACLMSASVIAGYYRYYSGLFTPPDSFPLVLALALIALFGWSGLKGVMFWKGRELGYGALLGLIALLLIQVPIMDGQPKPGWELSSGLQYAVFFSSAEERFVFKPLANLSINTDFEQGIFGINIVALIAAFFVGLKFIDKWRKDDTARIPSSRTASDS